MVVPSRHAVGDRAPLQEEEPVYRLRSQGTPQQSRPTLLTRAASCPVRAGGRSHSTSRFATRATPAAASAAVQATSTAPPAAADSACVALEPESASAAWLGM